MSQFGIFLVDAGVLIVLWAFVLAAVLVIRRDLSDRQALVGVPAATGVARPTAASTARRPTPSAGSTTVAGPATRLTVTNGARRGTTVELGGRAVVIGRAPDCTLTIPDDYISSRHARLTPQADGWLVEDLGSTNGTFVGGSRVTTPVRVGAGASIRLGQTVLELHR